MRIQDAFHARPTKWACFTVAAAALAACGGGGSDSDDGVGSSPKPGDTAGSAYLVGGNVEGLASGAKLVLQNNAKDDLEIASNGVFTFHTPVAKGDGYLVTVKTQPSGQTCSVFNERGSAEGPVDDVIVTCATGSGGGGGGSGSETAQWIEDVAGACVTYPAGTVTDHASTNGGARIEDKGDTVVMNRGVFQFAGPNCTGANTFTTASVHTYTVRERYTYSGVPILRLTGTIESAGGVTSGPLNEVWWYPSPDKLCNFADSPITQTNEEIGEFLPFANQDTCMVPFRG